VDFLLKSGVNVFFPFIDHCLMQSDQRFPADKTDMFLASKLMPLTIATMTPAEISSLCLSPFSLSSTIVVLFHSFRQLKAEKDRSHGTDPIGMVSRMWKISRMFG
jgi:hypothetical protein